VVSLKKHIKTGGVGISFYLYFLVFFIYLQTTQLANAEEKPSIQLTQSTQEIWQRQQLLVTLIVETKDPFARLDADNFQQQGMSIIAYPLKKIEGKNKTQLILQWAIFPFISGKLNLPMPTVVFRPNKGRKQTLALNKLSINVKKLPLYIPPTLPVGKITLKNNWDNGFLIKTNELIEWKLSVIGENIAAETMPPLSQQLVSTNALTILPSTHKQKTILTEHGIIQQRYYQIPLKAHRNGKLALPKVTVQFFDPATGKLNKIQTDQPYIISLDRWLLSTLVILSILLLLYISVRLSSRAKLWLTSVVKRRQATRLFMLAENYQQTRSAINQLALVEGWGANLSLTDFLEAWQEKYGKSAKLETKIHHLQAQYFSSKPVVNVLNKSRKNKISDM